MQMKNIIATTLFCVFSTFALAENPELQDLQPPTLINPPNLEIKGKAYENSNHCSLTEKKFNTCKPVISYQPLTSGTYRFVLTLKVDNTGEVTDVQFLKKTDDSHIKNQVEKFAWNLKFNPATIDGVPVNANIRIPINIVID